MMKTILIFISFILFYSITSIGQKFRNLDFSQLCDTSKTGFCYWDLSWGGKTAVKPEKLKGEQSLLITGATEASVGFAEQSTIVNKLHGPTILTLSANVSADRIKGKGAGLNIGLYDIKGQLIASRDMGGFYSLDWIQGSSDWKNYSISIICPPETKKIKLGAILFGKGKAFFRDYQVSLTTLENRRPSKLARDFISDVCDTIQKHSLVRDSINIKEMEATALKIAGQAKHYSDCYLAVNYLLESLRPFGDHHSFLMKADEVRNWKQEGSQVSKIEYPAYKRIDGFGYISVPAFHGGNQALINEFADSLHRAIKILFESGVKGWIVDLRQNTGGNMAPMVAGLGPLFSSEKLGSLFDVNGKPESWYYTKGNYHWDNDTGWHVVNPMELTANFPIAVLTSNRTGSSGEAVTISFIGNKNTKSFGSATWGLTTGNGSFDLRDGSQIYIASTIMADRNGKKYYGPVTPDIIVETSNNSQDAVMIKAIEWLNNEKANN